MLGFFDDMPAEFVEILLDSFQKYEKKCKFIVKIPEDTLSKANRSMPINVVRMDWIPQEALLGKSNIVVCDIFISICVYLI